VIVHYFSVNAHYFLMASSKKRKVPSTPKSSKPKVKKTALREKKLPKLVATASVVSPAVVAEKEMSAPVTENTVHRVPEVAAPVEVKSAAKPQSDKRKWFGLVMLSLALAIIIIDATVLNVSQKQIIKDLGTDLKQFQWSSTIYSLVVAAFVITGGRLGDFFGKKNMFLLGAVLFAVGSYIASIANSIEILTLGRSLVAGVGAALMLPATTSLLIANFVGKERNIAFGIWGMAAGTSAAIGPILGGYFTSTPGLGWHWAFLINVFIVAFIMLFSRFIPGDPHEAEHKQKIDIDYGGIVFSALGFGAFVYGIIESSEYGLIKAKKMYEFLDGKLYSLWGDLSVSFYAILLGIALIIAFFWWERRVESMGRKPIVSTSLFANRNLNVGMIVSMALAIGQTGFVFTIPVFLQVVKGKNALESGLAFLPFSLAVLVASPLAGALSNKFKPKYLIQLGFLLGTIGVLFILSVLKVSSDVWDLVPGFAIFGFGFGLITAPLSAVTLAGIKPEQYGEASGVLGMVRQLGQTMGIAVIGTVFLTSLSNAIPAQIEKSTVMTDQYKKICSEYLADTANLYRDREPNQLPCLPQEKTAQLAVPAYTLLTDITPAGLARLGQDIKSAVDESVVIGNKDALWYNVAFFVLVTVIASLFVTPKKPEGVTLAGADAAH
jgi:EmrB/QacA subfamily drug resistance transporter